MLNRADISSLDIGEDESLVIRYDFANTFRGELYRITPTLVDYEISASASIHERVWPMKKVRALAGDALRDIFRTPPAALVSQANRKDLRGTGRHSTIWHEPELLTRQLIARGATHLKGTAVIWPNVVATADYVARDKRTLYSGIGLGIVGVSLGLWRRRRLWECQSCGYDLRATPPGNPCPECGKVPEEVTKPVASQ